MDRLIIKRAVISVANKSGLDTLGKTLHEKGVELISTGGSARFLQNHEIPTVKIEDVNKAPEAFDGRVKTLGFSLFGGILFNRDKESHRQQAQQHSISPVDLVVCNLYPFSEVRKKRNVSRDELIENIDIGGVALIRAASKNYRYVCVLSSPDDYGLFLEQFEQEGSITKQMREHLAVKGFIHTYHYDQVISLTLSQSFKQNKLFEFYSPYLGESLRYGENPHQEAELIQLGEKPPIGVKLYGKDMSYNNYLDADTALNIIADLNRDEHFGLYHNVTIIKHGNPCGLCSSDNQLKSLKYAWQGDSVSSFGGILCFNKTVEKETAEWIIQKFVELILAPSFSCEALVILKKKKYLRILETSTMDLNHTKVRSITGGLLLQNQDRVETPENFRIVTKKAFEKDSLICVTFGIISCKYLKSNAISLVRKMSGGYQLVGAGMGNPNRLVSVEQAVAKARENGIKDFQHITAVSDAFFPFKDGVELLAEYGIRSVVQPGGSIRDEEVVKVCDRLGMKMIFTGRRHFSH